MFVVLVSHVVGFVWDLTGLTESCFPQTQELNTNAGSKSLGT